MHIMAKPGTFNFEQYDPLVDRLEKEGLQMLPILQGFDWELEKTRPDLVPLYKHPEAWRQFVRAVVSRYHTRMKIWEIWNEQDGGFWKPKPNASQYVPLLKIAYEEIKAIDPQAQVMVGGLCGWNVDYLRQMYAAGAAGHFDIMAVHPYGWGPDANPEAVKKMAQFRTVMTEHGDGQKEIWITESGSSTFANDITAKDPETLKKAIRLSLTRLQRTEATPATGFFVQPSEEDTITDAIIEREWLPGVKMQRVTLPQLATLQPAQMPVLIGSENYNVDTSCLQPLQDYVARGGLMVNVNRIPFYYIWDNDTQGNRVQVGSSNLSHPMFRIAFEAWWTKKGYPEFSQRAATTQTALAAGIADFSTVYANRYLSPKNLHKGDTYLPLIEAKSNNGAVLGALLALYQFKDWKGGILVNTTPLRSGVTEAGQATLLQRMYLTYLAAGVRKIFFYDLHDDGQETGEMEHNFGLVRWNWSPKPAHTAYAAMTNALGKAPQFIKRIETSDPHMWALLFRRTENNQHVLATWISDKDNRTRWEIIDGDTTNITQVQDGNVRFIPLSKPIEQLTIRKNM
ncbi:hypothetical protein Ga0100230_018750 [Opitutaceae bacterium TAV3]|nr:hypothetical protein Ga0100230_018750 [Opitutaceae bacterium TAV3]